jgi:hypothetical protein
MPLPELQAQAESLRARLHQAVGRMPGHAEFIDQSCKAA